MKSNILIFLLISIFLFTSVSAAIDYDDDNKTYTIDTWVPTWLGSDGESQVRLIDNTDTCLINCEATLEFQNERPVNLLDGFVFENRVGTEVSDKLQDLKFLLGKYENITKTRNIYEEVCEEKEYNITNTTNITNETTYTYCYNNLTGSENYTEEEFIWSEYDGEEVGGQAFLKIEGKKKLGYNVDWIITFRGKELTEWAWWDTDWSYKREIPGLTGNISAIYNVTYNANMETDFSDLRFLDNGETIELNYSIINKVDSDYAQVRINNLGESSVYMYYGNAAATDNSDYGAVIFEPISAYTLDVNANDDVGSNDGTVSSATHILSGKISGAFDFDGTNDKVTSDSNTGLDARSESISLWVNLDSTSENGAFFVTGESATSGNALVGYAIGVGSNTMDSAGNDLVILFENVRWIDTNEAIETGWHHIVMTLDASGEPTVYLDGSSIGTYSGTAPNSPASYPLHIGGYDSNDQARYVDATIDEVAIYDYALSENQIGKLYTMNLPSFTIGDEEENSAIVVNLNSPTNAQEFTNKSIYFDCNATSPTGVYQLNFSIDGVLNQTVDGDGTTNLTFSNVIDLDDGNHNYTCAAYDDTATTNSTYTFSIDTTPFINYTSPTYANGTNLTAPYIPVNVTLTEQYFENVTFNFYKGGALNESVTFTDGTRFYNKTGCTCDDWAINVTTCTTTGKCNTTETRYYTIDILPPEITITSPLTGYAYLYPGTELDLNYIAVDASDRLDSCWYEYNFTINPLTCGTNTTFNYQTGYDNITVYANDTFGNENSLTREWSLFFETFDLTYEPITYEGVVNTYTAEIDLGTSEILTAAVFNYNGTNYSSSISYSSGSYILSTSITAPSVTEDTNFSFGYIVTIGGSVYQPRTDNQTVSNVEFSNCSTGDLLLNFSLLDEETKSVLLGDIELNAYITNKVTTTQIDEINLTYDNISYAPICLTPNASFDNYYFFLTARYESDNHVPEFYNIQQADLAEYPAYINLYDLSSNDSTEFLIKYQDDNLIPVEGAIIQLQRAYIGEDAYYTVEAPKTSNLGTAIVHIDLNTREYRASVVKNGEVLGTFNNIVFDCENELSGLCEHSLIGQINPQNIIGGDVLRDFSYTIAEVNETITVSFSIPSGTASEVEIILNQEDLFGDENLCNSSIVSTGGSLSCSYNDSFSDSTLNLKIYKNDVLITDKTYMVPADTDLGFLGNNFFIVFIFLVSLVAMAYTSPEFMIFNAVLTLLLFGSLWLLQGLNFVTGIGGLVWLFIAGGILIYKLTLQEDR